MPALDTTQIAAISNQYIVPDLRQQWKNFDSLLTYLLDQQAKVKKLMGGSNDFKIPVVMSKNTTKGPFSGYDALSVDPVIQLRYGTLAWKFYYGNLSISDQELAMTENSEAAKGLFDALKENMMASMRDELGTDIYNLGTDSLRINGLRQIVDSTTSYAGLDPATYTDWASIEDPVTSEVSLSSIGFNHIKACSGAEAPDVMVTTKHVWFKIMTLLQEQVRYKGGEVLTYGADLASGKEGEGSPGHKYVEFMGAKLFMDDYCPGSVPGTADNHLFGLWSPALRFIIHKDWDFAVAKDKIRPINQNVTVVPIRFAGNLVATKRKRFYKMTGLDASA